MQVKRGSPQARTGSQQVKALPESTRGIAAVEGEIPIMMPAKLATNKVSPLSFVQKRLSLALCMLLTPWPSRYMTSSEPSSAM